ncbi:MAG: ABC transporter permease [Desulfobacterales bacterium]|nr:ABC transporter permease [Desulfobacterales bacterium]
MNKKGYVLRRIGHSIVTLGLILTLNFFLFRMLPGDPLRLLFTDPRVPLETLEKLRIQYGLDGSLWHQYGKYLVNTLQGELGTSFVYNMPVSEILVERLINTVILLLPATLFSILLGCLLGVISAIRRGRAADFIYLSISQLLWATPAFWLGLLFMMFASGVLPLSGMVTAGISYDSLWEKALDLGKHMAMPLCTLSLVMLGQYAIVMRNSLIDVLTEDYMVIAKAKGFSRPRQLITHALPNAILPVMTLAALNLGLLIGGAIQTETVFTWPGVGRLVFDALLRRDYPVLQGAFLVISTCALLANLLADLVYKLIDPRIEY